MEVNEAAQLIEAIAKSIEQNPGQFHSHFTVNVTGTKVTSIGGGTGLSVQVTGGGPGSQTTGFQSSISGANIEIAQKAVDAIVSKQMSALAETLNNLVSELRRPTPSKTRIGSMVDSLKQTWVPNVIASLIANIITRVALG
ncbi:MAG: hypothetical protein MUP49_00445 [Dehalococcoidia bacterium]|nr:hypothetical protein [Dehalococcoidia bacterium]